MKMFKRWLFVGLLAILIPTMAMAAEAPMVENYAHPTLFGEQVQQTVEAQTDSVYVVGDKVAKPEDQITVKCKDNVLVESWVKDILSLIKSNSNSKMFNPKMPILRSELAVVLAEGLSIKQVKPRYQYRDIEAGYWAKPWIDKVLSEGIMIGYPDKKFRPDQPITKAEVFATVAQLINVPIDKNAKLCCFKGNKMQFIPNWAVRPTNEVLASKLMDEIPDSKTAACSKYLSKEQVAYLIAALRESYAYNSKFACSKYKPTFVTVKMDERLDARHSNIGDSFTATTTQETIVKDKKFCAGSKVKGEVVGINRPGFKNPGYIKVKFIEISNDDCTEKFPCNISDVKAKETKNTNVVARLFAAPFSSSARVVGVIGRSAGTGVLVIANSTERFGDDWSNAFANLMSGKAKSSARSVGKSFVTAGRGIYNVSSLIVSGAYGAVYEMGDELMYLVLPSKTNDSSLNPNEELIIIY